MLLIRPFSRLINSGTARPRVGVRVRWATVTLWLSRDQRWALGAMRISPIGPRGWSPL